MTPVETFTTLPKNPMMPFGDGRLVRSLILSSNLRYQGLFRIKGLKKAPALITVGSVNSIFDRDHHDQEILRPPIANAATDPRKFV